MEIILRKAKGSRLTITELDKNFRNLAMNLNDIDIFWRNDQSDIVSDTMYIRDKAGYFLRTFNSLVYRLGLKIKDYDLIKDYNPEFVIERYKKTSSSHGIALKAQFRITEPYSEYVKSNEMGLIDPTKVDIYRPMIFPITATSSYTRIYAENYFSQVKPPKVLGSSNNFYKLSTLALPGSSEVFDDTNTYSINLPRKQVGIVYCRLRIRITDDFGNTYYSNPLKKFRIRMIMKDGVNSMIKYDMV